MRSTETASVRERKYALLIPPKVEQMLNTRRKRNWSKIHWWIKFLQLFSLFTRRNLKDKNYRAQFHPTLNTPDCFDLIVPLYQKPKNRKFTKSTWFLFLYLAHLHFCSHIHMLPGTHALCQTLQKHCVTALSSDRVNSRNGIRTKNADDLGRQWRNCIGNKWRVHKFYEIYESFCDFSICVFSLVDIVYFNSMFAFEKEKKSKGLKKETCSSTSSSWRRSMSFLVTWKEIRS